MSKLSWVSRRHLFGLVAAGIGLIAGRARSAAQTQVSKEAAHYQDTPNDGRICADCRNFKPPNACLLVEGAISPNGWCSFYNEA